MSADVWNSLAGYVIIKIEGMSLERVMNKAIKGGIHLWDVRRDRCSITACVSVHGFYVLRSILHGTSCRVRILEKHGLIIGLSNMRFRKIMLFGWIVVLFFLLAASRFLWFIQIDGVDRVTEADVLGILSDLGISPGIHRGSFDAGKVGTAIMAADPRIAWAGAELTGVILNVSIREAEEGAQIITQGASGNIYAAKDGVITDITALSGKPLYHVGDAVLKGQLLISGDLGNELSVQARGTVTARVLYRFISHQSWEQTLWIPSGNVLERIEVRLRDQEFLKSSIPFEKWERQVLKTSQMPSLIPFVAETVRYSELIQTEARASEDQLVELAMAEAESTAARSVDKDAVIVSKQSDYTADESGVTYTVTIIAEENIAQVGN